MSTILRAAEAERHRAELALDTHYDTCTVWPQEACPACRELAALAAAAAQDVARLRWKQELATRAKAQRNRRGTRSAPAITGIRIPAPPERKQLWDSTGKPTARCRARSSSTPRASPTSRPRC